MDPFKMAYTVVGGLGIFILGMKYLSESFQVLSGNFIRKLIGSVTSNRIFAVFVGLIVTCLIQSSSICTVMTVGFVNAGLMNLQQAIGVILGSNIGTTITGWILVVKVGKYGLLLVALGIFPMLFSRNERVSSTAKILVALGFIFFGLQLMSGAFKPLRTHEGFISFMHYLAADSLFSVLGCVVVGCIMTCIVQSSSAMLGITIALAVSGSLTFPTAAALVLGENIGTTITAQLAAIGGTVSARRAAMAHTMFNVFGVLTMVLLFQPFLILVDSFVPGSPENVLGDGTKNYIAAHIAMGHSLFNVSATVLAIPLLTPLARLVSWLIPDKSSSKIKPLTAMLSSDLIPRDAALSMAKVEVQKIARKVGKAFQHSHTYLLRDVKDVERFRRKVNEIEEEVDERQVELTRYIVSLMRESATFEQSDVAYSYIRAADELESISDYSASLCQYKKSMNHSSLSFSDEAWHDVKGFFHRVLEFYNVVVRSCISDELVSSEWIEEEKVKLTELADQVRDRHLKRLTSGTCDALSGLTFSDIVVALRRIKNHTVNFHEALSFHSESMTSNAEVSSVTTAM